MRQRGSVHLAVFATLFIISAFLMFGLMGMENYYLQEKATMDRNIKYLQDEMLKLNNDLQELESLSGFFHNKENRSNFADISQARVVIPNLLGQLQKVHNKELELPTLAISDVELAEKKENSLTLEKMLFSGFERIQELQNEIAMLEHQSQIISENKRLQEEYRKQITDEMNDWLKTLGNDIESYQTQFDKKLKDVEALQQKYELAKNEAIQKAQEAEQSIQNDKNEFEIQIEQKKNEIRKLQAQKYGESEPITKQRIFRPEEEKYDGTISFSDARTKTVYIDLGQSQKIIKGLKFDVYRQANQAAKIWIGQIEIQKVMEKVSMATIVKIKDPLNPIVPGDSIMNPIFNYKEPVYITLAGNLKKSNATMKQLIEELGAIIEPQVSVRTNFVVYAPKSETTENYRAAINFGVPLMSEDVVLQYIGD